MRHKTARWLTFLLAVFAQSFLIHSSFAADDDDPPARAARLSFTSGAVSFEPAGTDEWVEAAVNRPMAVALALYALALLSKETAVCFILLLPAADWIFFPEPR